MTGTLGRGCRPSAMAVCLGIAAVAVIGLYVRYVPYGLAWNLTPSIPEGLYLSQKLTAHDALKRGDVACFQYVAPAWAVSRDYGAPKLRMCKPVVGLPGDRVAVDGSKVELTPQDGGPATAVRLLAQDSKGRPMPQAVNANGVVAPDTVFMLSTYRENSLDSRYLGAIPRAVITHRVSPLWVHD
jgi:conjugative transfer signal peptidase TraF